MLPFAGAPATTNSRNDVLSYSSVGILRLPAVRHASGRLPPVRHGGRRRSPLGAGDLLHGLNAGAHGLRAPFVEELASPGGRVVVPELLKPFFKKICVDGFQVIAEEVAQAGVLPVTKILGALQQQTESNRGFVR